MNNDIYEDSDLDQQDASASAGMVVCCGAVIAGIILSILMAFYFAL